MNPNQNDGDLSTSYYAATRRRLLSLAALVVGCGSLPKVLQAKPRSIRIGDRLSDLRFRVAFVTALRVLRRRGRISQSMFVQLKRASYSGLPIAQDAPTSGPLSVPRPFVVHLRQEVVKMRTKQPDLAGRAIDFRSFFSSIADWIVENWDQVLRVVMLLLTILQKAESE